MSASSPSLAPSSSPSLAPMVLAVAPNGARKQYDDHAALPLTADELADTAVNCLAAGASMMHLHVRDANLAHSIDATRYNAAFDAIRQRVGEEQLFLQATTEAVGLFDTAAQMAAVRELAAKQAGQATFGVSIAVREMMPVIISDSVIADFFAFLKDRTILPQLILYDTSDCQRLQDLLHRHVLPGRAYPCLFVLGRYADNQQSDPSELLPFFANMTGISSWMGCAFGRKESAVAAASALLGGQMRIGFENNLHLADGRLAADNGELIAQTASQLARYHRRIATYEETKALMTPDW
ncbi:BKACE family enzyme [Ostreibacterium oceani]|uniref:3-keto-5-aminohexanoate cleavage protein n=1 Tax=Ostreibacterium oceani TaxID=2654998 RepID=A0A6N7F499_9GAMM|nr:3-keto-5-aminohexanoate cleavage protein [Ostreibacterium oceani]MPV86706.1 3-keto-5-aminohexanoate cleavage protein [Ostreibacterium oceani]